MSKNWRLNAQACPNHVQSCDESSFYRVQKLNAVAIRSLPQNQTKCETPVQELQAELSQVNQELQAELSQVKQELQAELSQVNQELKAVLNQELKAELSQANQELKAELSQVNQELQAELNQERKAELSQVNQELKAELSQVNQELQAELNQELKAELSQANRELKAELSQANRELKALETHSLENVQYFALKLCSKNWSSSYSSLLLHFNCATLSSRRKNTKLFILYKFLNGYVYFPSNIFHFQPPPRMSIRSYHPYNLLIPFARTSALLHSFVPSSCSIWNSLPSYLKDCPSLSSFMYHLRNYPV